MRFDLIAKAIKLEAYYIKGGYHLNGAGTHFPDGRRNWSVGALPTPRIWAGQCVPFLVAVHRA